jgi:hypothetical protein
VPEAPEVVMAAAEGVAISAIFSMRGRVELVDSEQLNPHNESNGVSECMY